MTNLTNLGKQAKVAARSLASAHREQKDRALVAIADTLMDQQTAILEANRLDVDDSIKNGLSEALIDRLKLTETRMAAIAADARRVAELPDPVGLEFDSQTLPNGLQVRKRRTPIGVLGVIYEARPNVTVDVATLALKSGNAAILRGGKETLRSNIAMIAAIQKGLTEAGLPEDSILYIDDPDRALVLELLKLDAYVDMIIPRGGAGLHRFCRENATIPVITGGIGICHLFVDASADLDRAVEIIHNAKTQRPSVCNALDTALIHRDVAAQILPNIVGRLGPNGVCFKADGESVQVLGTRAEIEPAGPEDWDTEWLSLVLGLKIVSGLEEAIQHIQDHSTGHSDGILTNTSDHATRFVDTVDSAVVYVNASTRFTDGSQLGLGAEVAVSTQKLHARGPMALQELTSYKWIVIGDGQIRE